MSSTNHQNRKNVKLIGGKVVVEEVPGFPIGQPEFIPAKKCKTSDGIDAWFCFISNVIDMIFFSGF